MSYTKLETSDNRPSISEDGSSQDYLLPTGHEYRRGQSPSRHRTYLFTGLAITTSVLTFILGLLLGTSYPFQINKDLICTRHVSESSPLTSAVPISYHTQRFNGSLFKTNAFRLDAGPEVDAAWESLGVNYRSVAVPLSDGAAANLRPDQVKINPKYGGGFPANVEGLHQLHCLNLVRQSLYYNYDHYRAEGKGAFVNEDHVVKAHVSHCLDIVRQQLMCTVDVGFLGQVWTNPSFPRAFVDFNTKHTCRNFDAVRQWAEDHQLPIEPPSDFLQPPEEGDLIYAEIP